MDYWQQQTADLEARLSESVAMNWTLRRQMQEMTDAAKAGTNSQTPSPSHLCRVHMCYWRRFVEEISRQLLESKAREKSLIGQLEVERGSLGQTGGEGSMSGDELREIVAEGITAEELLEKIQRTELLLTLTLRHAPIIITHADLDLKYT